MPAGRPPKPTATLKLHGGLRKGLHDNREREPQPEGDAIMVKRLTGEALKIWKHLHPRLAALGLATELDSHELLAMCQWWAKYQKYISARKDDYRNHNMAATAYKQFRAIASKFGLTPSDRVGLECAVTTDNDELREMLRQNDRECV